MPDPEKQPDEAAEFAAHEQRVNEDSAEADERLLKQGGQEKPDETEADQAGKEKDSAAGEAKDEAGAAPAFDAEILSIARDLGIDEATARSHSTVRDLELHLSGILAREETQGAKPESKKEEEKPKAEPVRLEAGDELDEEIVNRVNAALDKLSDRHDVSTKALEAQVQALESTLQAGRFQQFVSEFDGLLGRHGGAYRDDLGEGSTFGLGQSSKERANRGKVIDEMSVIVASHQIRNRPIPGDEQLLARALREVFGERSPEKENEAETEKRPFLRRGSSKAPQAPTSRQRSLIALDEKLSALGGGDEQLLEKTA